jgi:hypothetical protein
MLTHSANACVNCDLSGERDYRIEALCLFAEKSALAGNMPLNPIEGDEVSNYVKAYDHDGELLITTGQREKYLDPL